MTKPHPLIATLAAERQRRGISVAAIAYRTGYTSSAVRRWEAGRTPGLLAVEDYANALDLQLTLAPMPTSKQREI